MGGENVDETLRGACADLNVATEYSTTDRKAAGERTHGLLSNITRAALLGASASASTRDWPFARAWAAFVINATAPNDTTRVPPFYLIQT